MLTLKEIRERLQDRRPEMVAQGTGLHYNTIRGIRDNPDVNPKYRTVEILSEYLGGGLVKQ